MRGDFFAKDTKLKSNSEEVGRAVNVIGRIACGKLKRDSRYTGTDYPEFQDVDSEFFSYYDENIELSDKIRESI